MNHKESSSRKNERAKLDKTERQWKGSKRWRRRAKNTNMLSTRKTQKMPQKVPPRTWAGQESVEEEEERIVEDL